MDEIAESSQQVIQAGSKSFAAAARLFTRDIREDVYLLYAWCRHCDDQIDGQELGFGNERLSVEDQQQRLARMQEMTRKALAGKVTDDPAFLGLQRVVKRHGIPPQYPRELLEGFAMDVENRRYLTLEDTLLYCYHVAGVVGVMMAHVMGTRDAETLERAADLGIAFQLTNIARDVMDDADNGRVYIPEQWLAEAGVPLTDIRNPEYRPVVFQSVKRLLDEADRYYASAREGLRKLPLRAAWAVSAADGVYRNIGDMLVSKGDHAWDERVVTPAYSKLYWVMRGGLRAITAVSLQKRRVMGPRAADLWTKPDLY